MPTWPPRASRRPAPSLRLHPLRLGSRQAFGSLRGAGGPAFHRPPRAPSTGRGWPPLPAGWSVAGRAFVGGRVAVTLRRVTIQERAPETALTREALTFPGTHGTVAGTWYWRQIWRRVGASWELRGQEPVPRAPLARLPPSSSRCAAETDAVSAVGRYREMTGGATLRHVLLATSLAVVCRSRVFSLCDIRPGPARSGLTAGASWRSATRAKVGTLAAGKRAGGERPSRRPSAARPSVASAVQRPGRIGARNETLPGGEHPAGDLYSQLPSISGGGGCTRPDIRGAASRGPPVILASGRVSFPTGPVAGPADAEGLRHAERRTFAARPLPLPPCTTRPASQTAKRAAVTQAAAGPGEYHTTNITGPAPPPP